VSDTLQTKERNEALRECCVDAALLLPSLHTARPRRWAGRYACFPHELKQAFAPIIQPHWERLKNGEIMEVGVFVPKVGFLRLRCRDGEFWVIFINDLEYAKQKLQLLRKTAAAVQHGTIVKNPQGGMWIFQPPLSILPLALKVFAPTNQLREQQLEFRRSPPWRGCANSFVDAFEDKEKTVKPSSRWLTPSIPCAVRAPTFALPLAER